MIDYNIPPELTMDNIAVLLKHMQPEDVKRFNEYFMIHFPSWMFKMIEREAKLCNMSYEQFVRVSCLEVIIQRIKERTASEQ